MSCGCGTRGLAGSDDGEYRYTMAEFVEAHGVTATIPFYVTPPPG